MWPSDGIWWHRSDSTLAQVMACYMMGPSHYLNQIWFFICGVLWHSIERISEEVLKISIHIMCWNITLLKLIPYHPGDNELSHIWILICTPLTVESGPHLNIKMVFTGMEIFHYKDKMVMKPSYLYNGNPYTGKTASLNWDDHLMFIA